MITLKGISNDVDLKTRETSYFLVFENIENGKVFRLPVSEETAEVLVRETMMDAPVEAPSHDDLLHHRQESREAIQSEEDQQFATSFGGDEQEVEGASDPYEGPELTERESPMTEDEVPSL